MTMNMSVCDATGGWQGKVGDLCVDQGGFFKLMHQELFDESG